MMEMNNECHSHACCATKVKKNGHAQKTQEIYKMTNLVYYLGCCCCRLCKVAKTIA